MSKELKFEFNDYIIVIDEPYQNDCGYVAIGKKDTKDNINIWFKSPNQQTVDFYIELQKHIADLEAKLVDTEFRYENLHNLYYKDTEELKQQLAEKEKEIEDLKAQRRIYLNRSVEECNKITDLEFELQHKNQDKISFTLEQLEKVKEFVKENESWEIEGSDYSIVYADDVLDEIDNQIKQLKENVNGKEKP